METLRLLISDPPHPNVDPMAAAPYFGLTAAEVRMKANYSIPEIWFTQDERESFDETASGLAEAGLRTVAVEGHQLVEISGPEPVVSIAFEETGLRVDLGDSERTIDYGASVIGVFGRPEPTEEPGRSTHGRIRRRTPSLGGDPVQPGSAAFLDLYVTSEEGVLRLPIVEGVTKVMGLPQDVAGPSGLFRVVTVCEMRFDGLHCDRRLVGMRTRLVHSASAAGSTRRSGFSFATTALADLLTSLSADLTRVGHVDLSSRLAYLTNRARIALG